MSRNETPGAASLDALFSPRSVAVLGASGRPDNPFSRPLTHLRQHGFEGAVYPINPKYDELEGWPCYASFAEVPGPIDLALVMVGASGVVDAVRDAGAAGVKVVIVSSSGFAEAGEAGGDLQEQLRAAAAVAGVRVVGPNCQGVLSVPSRLAATFTAAVSQSLPRAGGVAFVGQSGAVGGSVVDLAREAGLGLSEWVSTGNQVDVDVVEVAEHLVEQAHISVITMYLECAVDGVRFQRLARRAADLGTFLVVLRSGRSETGRRAVASHTGAMLAPDAAFEVVARRLGVVLVDDVDALLRAAQVLSAHPVPVGRRLAVVTTSGGAGGLAADRCDARGLELVALPAEVQEELAESIPDYGSTANPVDVTAQLFNRHEDAFRDVCLTVGRCEEVDQLVVVLTMIVGDMAVRLAHALTEVSEALSKPVHVVWLAGHDLTAEGRQLFRAAGIPVYSSVSDMADAAAVLAERSEFTALPPAVAPSFGLSDLQGLLPGPVVLEAQAGAFLDAIGIARPAGALARTAAEALEMAEKLGAPVAVKVQSTEVLHKTERGGIQLGLAPEAASRAWSQMVEDFGDDVDVLVQQMTPKGIELVLGVTTSTAGFPPLVSVGIGGIATELYKDLVSRPAPVTLVEAREMLAELRAGALLTGFRGAPPADVEAAAQAIASLSAAAAVLGTSLVEMEINPLIVAPGSGGAWAADFFARLTETPRG